MKMNTKTVIKEEEKITWSGGACSLSFVVACSGWVVHSGYNLLSLSLSLSLSVFLCFFLCSFGLQTILPSLHFFFFSFLSVLSPLPFLSSLFVLSPSVFIGKTEGREAGATTVQPPHKTAQGVHPLCFSLPRGRLWVRT